MSFRIQGLAPDEFRPLFDLDDAALAARGVRRLIADQPRMPCRVSLAHAGIGEEVLLLNYTHQPADNPYRQSHAIFVRRAAHEAAVLVDELPEVMTTRTLSVRAYDAAHQLIASGVCAGDEAAALFERLLADPNAEYLHVHNAGHGCYSARVERA